MLGITQLGSAQAYIALILVAYLAVDARHGRALALYVVFGFYLNQHLKGLYDTPRPFELEPGVARSEGALRTAIGPGFPSGHAQSSTTFWGLTALYARRAWVSVVAVLLVALVSVSRLYLGVHLPVDVIGGIAVGLLILLAAFAALHLRLEPPLWSTLALGVAVPLALHLALPVPDSGMLMGAASAFVIGPVLVPHRAGGPLGARVLVVALALVLVFGVQYGSSLLVPDDVRHGVLGSYLRYLVVGCVGTMLVPALARLLGLAPAPKQR
jgi:membrane-associated phospholipid phosphatase